MDRKDGKSRREYRDKEEEEQYRLTDPKFSGRKVGPPTDPQMHGQLKPVSHVRGPGFLLTETQAQQIAQLQKGYEDRIKAQKESMDRLLAHLQFHCNDSGCEYYG